MRKALRRCGARTKVLVRGSYGGSRTTRGRGMLCVPPQHRQLQCTRISPASLACSILTPVASQNTSTHRPMHILCPNVTRPDPATRVTLATPPPTDLDFSLSSSHDSDLLSLLLDVQSINGASDVLSEANFASDPELPTHRRALQPASSASDAATDVENDSGSDAGGGDQRSRTGHRGAVLDERRRDAALCSPPHRCVPYASRNVGPRALGIVAVAFACA